MFNGTRVTTERIKKLKATRYDPADRSEIPVRDRAYRLAAERHPYEPRIIQYAYGFAETLMSKSIWISSEDLLAGYLHKYTYNTNFPMMVSEDFDPSDRAKFRMDFAREVREAGELSADTEEIEEFAEAAESWLIKHWHSGHTLADYRSLLSKGIGGLQLEAAEQAERCANADEENTIRAFRIVLDAAEKYILRYKGEAEKLGLSKMADSLERISTTPPESFYEALQLVLLAHEMMYCENVPSAVSIGRLDQYLYSYFRNDVDSGSLTYEEAGELVDAFWLKVSCQKKAYQNLTLGGCGPEGKSAYNELTRICLESARSLKVDQPSVNYRWTDDQPEEAWTEVLELIKTGMGFPALEYDPCCMNALMRQGIAPEEVWDYAFIGCVEPAMAGRENAYTELARLNLPKLLLLMLNGGRDVMSGRTFCMKNGGKSAAEVLALCTDNICTDNNRTDAYSICADDKETDGICNRIDSNRTSYALNCEYEKLEEMFLDEVEFWVHKLIRSMDMMQLLYADRYPLPFLSVLTEDCIAKRKDVTAGGAKYQSAGFNLCGLATAVDSLMAIRELVFEERCITLEEYVRALDRDFEGAEELPARIRKCGRRYGNDMEEPDKLAASICRRVHEALQCHRTPLGGTYRLGLYTVEDHAIMGAATGATPDGRRAGESLSNSMGAVQGMDIQGPTALIKSATRFPMELSGNGMVLDVKFTPDLIETQTGAEALHSLIKAYFHNGGMEMQVSAVSGETLRAAQADPDHYGDLIVRVSGFSAYFCSLRKVTQDEIIRRTENTLR